MLQPCGGAMLRNRSALLLLVRAVHAHAEAAPACAAPPPGVSAYPLIQKWSAGNQSYVLRFALPPEEGAIGWRGVKAFLDGEDENADFRFNFLKNVLQCGPQGGFPLDG